MPEQSPARPLLLSLITAVAGAAALTLSFGATSPSVGLPRDAVLASTSTVASSQARVVPPLPASEVIRTQSATGLSCEMSLSGVPLCLHGEDEAHVTAGGSTAATPRGGSIGCYGDGTSGPRVRAVYARPASAPDRYGSSLGSIREWAAGISSQIDASAARTNGRRHVRYATTSGASCTLTVLNVVLPDTAFASFRATIDALQARGLDAPWSKYLVWSEGSGYCGMGTTYADDSPGLDNLNNSSLPAYARIDRRCWGKVETHELVHMLGGVQRSAPNATAGFHCSDGRDVLCYDDGSSGGTQRSVCGNERAHLLDCRNDDYFSTAAPRGSYLQTHWNTARSSYLAATLREPAPAPSAAPPAGSPSPAPAASSAPPSARPSAAPSPSGSPRPGLLGPLPVPVPTLVAVPR